MKRFITLSSITVALFIATAVVSSPARAADGKGSVKGKVLRADGNPAGGAEVQLMAREARRKKPNANVEASADSTKPANQAKARREPAAQVKADDHGTFTLADVPAGQYVLAVRMKGEGAARQRVAVHAGDASEVTLKLQSTEQRRKAAAADDATRAQRRQARLDRRRAKAEKRQATQQSKAQ